MELLCEFFLSLDLIISVYLMKATDTLFRWNTFFCKILVMNNIILVTVVSKTCNNDTKTFNTLQKFSYHYL